MALFDFLNKRNVSAHQALNSDNVLGREGEQDLIDDEVPSVNRRKGKNKVTDMIGLAAILGAGITMLYVISSDTEPKPQQAKAEKPQIKNSLPPLVMPPPPPPVEVIVPPVVKPQEPIPLQNLNQASASNKPVLPTWSDRKMTGGLVLTADGSKGSSGAASQAHLLEKSAAETLPDTSPLGLKLKPTLSNGVSANLLPNRDYLITKGTALDCALETAIDSTMPGLTTCRLTRDVYSDNGHVVLLDRGSQLVGEYQGGLTQGQARIFVLWTRAKTPNGVIVALDSPGTDALGRSGHAGFVDRHFMERFGAAIMLSLVKDGIQLAKNNNSSPVTIGGGGSDQLATEVLKNTINIPPTLYINQGDHIQIMVGRDLDFSSVYGLELKE
ncbi:MAG: conjugal transfer protein [Betaproteobacteria bacterium HGW-Betaproteobacteria-22]|nr:MAG: conjugal transfer protein [Betaproteobacteria bacterium HGW-Betaproteobacteria-22]